MSLINLTLLSRISQTFLYIQKYIFLTKYILSQFGDIFCFVLSVTVLAFVNLKVQFSDKHRPNVSPTSRLSVTTRNKVK